jgi:hypothetical protein
MNESQIISWIAQEQDFYITISQEVTRTAKDEICSDFQKSLSFDGITSKRVFSLTAQKLKGFVCQV